jgi:hypothetical protein
VAQNWCTARRSTHCYLDGGAPLTVISLSPERRRVSRSEITMAKGIERDKKNNKPKLSTKEKQKKKKEKQAGKSGG